MRAQKKHKNNRNRLHHLPKIVVDFEPLWRCISKIRNETTRCMRGEILKQNNTKSKYVVWLMLNSVCLYILVSTSPLEFVNGELEDIPWWTVLPNNMILISTCIVIVVLLSELTSCSTDSIHSILLLAGYHSEKEKR